MQASKIQYSSLTSVPNYVPQIEVIFGRSFVDKVSFKVHSI